MFKQIDEFNYQLVSNEDEWLLQETENLMLCEEYDSGFVIIEI